MHYVYNAYHESSPFLHLLIYFTRLKNVGKIYGTILMKGKHYNTITSFVPYKNIIIYLHNKIFTIFINYLLPILFTTYYLGCIPTIYYLTYLICYYYYYKKSYIHIIKYLQFNLLTIYYLAYLIN